MRTYVRLGLLLAVAGVVLVSSAETGPAAGSSELCSFLTSPAARNVTWSFRWEDYVSCGLAQPLPESTLALDPPPSAGPLASPGADVRVNNPTEDIHPNETQNDATVAVKGNTVCVAYNDDVGGVGFARSVNRGAAFVDQGSVSSRGDPVLTVDADGHFALAHMRDGDDNGIPDQIAVSISEDDCQSFPVTYLVQQDALIDKPWVAADRTGGSYDGRIYTCWTEFQLALSHIKFRRGIPFTNPIVDIRTGGADNLVQGCQVAVGKDGEVFVAWEEGADTSQAGSIWLRRSLDGGDTFQAAVKVNENDLPHAADPAITSCDFFGGALGPAAHPIRIQDFPSLAANPVNNDVYLVWNERRDGNTDIVFYRSIDDGAAWAFMGVVHGVVTKDQFMPAVATGSDGAVKVQWYDRRNDTDDNGTFQLYAAKSVNRGVTFQEEVVADAVSDLDDFVPLPPPVCYMGDYNGLVGDAKQVFHVWGDNRDTVHDPPDRHLDPNVYFDWQSLSVPAGGIAELPDVASHPGRSGGDDALVVALAAAAAGVLAVGVWYARRRFGWRRLR